jgi:RNA polymerase sigma-B factor
VRISRREQEKGEHAFSHLSLDASVDGESCLLDRLEAPAPDTESTAEPLAEGMEALLDQLPAAQAAFLRLTILGGLSLRQAARQLGISAMSVQGAQKKALATLRQQVSA